MSTIINRFFRYGMGLAAQLIFSMAFAQNGGLLDISLNPTTGTNGNVWASAMQADGKILIGGSFTTYQGMPANRIARLNEDGSFDATFNTYGGFDAAVYSIVVQPDGNILIGGDFTTIAGKPYKYIVRLMESGIFESVFTVSSHYPLNAGVRAIALQSDGKIVVGGLFTMHGGVPRNRITRFNADGTTDTTFNPGSGANNFIAAVAISPSGQCYIGGDFTSFNGAPCGRIARLNINGSLDPIFNSIIGGNNSVRAIAIYPDGFVAVGGMFTQYNGTARNRLARVGPNGALDVSFTPPNSITINKTIYTLLIMHNQKLIVGGMFDSGTPKGVLRLLTDGTLDGTFNPGAAMGMDVGPLHVVSTSFMDPYLRIFIAGKFTSYNGTTRNNAARLMGLPSFVLGNGEPGTLESNGTSVRSAHDSSAMSGDEGHVVRLYASMAIYPNPNNGMRLKVDLSAIPWSESPIHLRILDLQGRLAFNPWLVIADGTLQTELDLEGLKDGVYLLRAENSDRILGNSRLVVQH